MDTQRHTLDLPTPPPEAALLRGGHVPPVNNTEVVEDARLFIKAVQRLHVIGCVVLRGVITAPRPVIYIRNTKACRRLKGAIKIRRAGPEGREVIMAAPFDGCQVEWLVRGDDA